MTTIEFVEKLRAYREEGGAEFSTESAYDLGVFENVRSVLGESPLFWLLPVGGPMGDGLRFDTRPEEALESASEEEADPEEAHPAGAEEVASSAGSSATASGDCASFLVWHSAADFVDDVRVGCETIEEAYEGTLAQFAALPWPPAEGQGAQLARRQALLAAPAEALSLGGGQVPALQRLGRRLPQQRLRRRPSRAFR
eukprot:CAMPEP_0176317744 /NCGR_PEP_ID=MMETSP0121_2-20121125/69414_1 /TAXON_ID=160619 /ORGANISM="Kryptoperidinium foliaceum, Strain CCMP 1326" /LENGTH=197 /DNA_ID=CAMNT_0017660011 /DNA_START=291 /DNA_END=879 /DNA_ORIENTATION=-